ncbi:hypothetical protein BGZ60DRAFT_527149 [Tricladium varicosporioides]|nr:hypothetical protein BGZ60DRAFT_527149 [Hymenoscyphus varicosporioides]
MTPLLEIGLFECRQCNYKCNTEDELNQHKAASSRHTCCRVCFKDFVTKEACDRHEKQFHGAKQILPCSCCGFIFTTLGGLISHFERRQCEAVPDFRDRQKHKKEFYDNHNNIRNFVEFGRTAGDFVEEELKPKLIRAGEVSNGKTKNLLDDDNDNLSFGEPEVDNWPTRQQNDDAGDLIDFSAEYSDTVAYVEGDDLLTFDVSESIINEPWNQNIAKAPTAMIAMPHLGNTNNAFTFTQGTVRLPINQEAVLPHLRKTLTSISKPLRVIGVTPVEDNILGATEKPNPIAPALTSAETVMQSPLKQSAVLDPTSGVWGSLPRSTVPSIISAVSSNVWDVKPKAFTSIAAATDSHVGNINPRYEHFVQQKSTSQATKINQWGAKDTINPQAGRIAAQLAASLRVKLRSVSCNNTGRNDKENCAWPKLGESSAGSDEHSSWFADLPSLKLSPVHKPQDTSGWGIDAWGTDSIELLAENASFIDLNQPRVSTNNDKANENLYNPDTLGFNAEKYYVPALRKYKCPHRGCKKSNNNKSAFIQHLRSAAHAKGNFQCRKCLRTFGTATALTQHSASQGVRCDVRNTEAYSAVVDEFTAGTAAPVGHHTDETIRYAVNDIAASALKSGNIAAHHKAAAVEANNNFNSYWNTRRPAW